LTIGPVGLSAPTSQPQTPVVVEQIVTSTSEFNGPALQSLGIIRILGNSNQGIQIKVPETGIYRFSYKSGSYATYPVGGAPKDLKTWLTAVCFFRGDRALWDGTRLRTEDALLRLTDVGYRLSAEEAENVAYGQYLDVQLTEGDILTLIAVDHLDAYADNPGQIVIEWLLVRY
jgi:hypothetical protein